MNVNLTPEFEQLVDEKVRSGRYDSPIDVVREALMLLEQRGEMFTSGSDDIRRQIEEGWQSARRGELVDGDQVFRILHWMRDVEAIINS